jgi:hypothetical protein
MDAARRVHTVNRFYAAYSPSKIVDEILTGNEPINKSLYEYYSRNLRKGVEQVYHDGSAGTWRAASLRANVSRFAAYKAYHATQIARRERVDKNTGEIFDRKDTAKATLGQFRAWLDTEYNTTVARTRTAKQWEKYLDPDSTRLFPNIKWLPSGSVERRPEHVAFYNRVWAKDDPFWANNTPGTLWNCKCDMQETGEHVTEGNAEIPQPPIPIGLEGNPGMTGEVFTDKANYISSAPNKAEGFFRKEYREFLREKNSAKSEIKDFDNLAMGKLKLSDFSYKNIVNHAYNEKELAAVDYLVKDIKALKNPIFERLGEVKDMANPKDIKNVKSKRKRGVRGYYAYRWNFNNKEYVIKTEKINNVYEQLDSIAPVK